MIIFSKIKKPCGPPKELRDPLEGRGPPVEKHCSRVHRLEILNFPLSAYIVKREFFNLSAITRCVGTQVIKHQGFKSSSTNNKQIRRKLSSKVYCNTYLTKTLVRTKLWHNQNFENEIYKTCSVLRN